MKNFTNNILLIGVILLASCSAGKNLLEQGNYYEAVVKSVDRLRNNPENSRARQTLKTAYPLAIDWYLDKVKICKPQILNSNGGGGELISNDQYNV